MSHPHHLVIAPSSAPVLVTHDGVVLAETTHAIVLREGSLPPRYYIAPDDIRMELLTPTQTASHCPFKGDATYWSIDGVPDVAWSYATPIEGAEAIAGLIAFYNEKVTIEVER
jgi:uncharacterized protein (DUF427 family)